MAFAVAVNTLDDTGTCLVRITDRALASVHDGVAGLRGLGTLVPVRTPDMVLDVLGRGLGMAAEWAWHLSRSLAIIGPAAQAFVRSGLGRIVVSRHISGGLTLLQHGRFGRIRDGIDDINFT